MNTENKSKITVLGKSFNTEEERRNYFRGELRKKLPELKNIEGFPIGEDEDIVALSDPPYYTACPNPWLNDFIEEWENAKDSIAGRDAYFHVDEPYANDISEGKNNPLYNAHTYHTKVPHPAIMRYIMHYTQPGDIIFDGFAGTGMTGVAVGQCMSPEYEVRYLIEKEFNGKRDLSSQWGERHAILNDLSPIAAFISRNYNSKTNEEEIIKTAEILIKEINSRLDWAYKTKHINGQDGTINYIVWSEILSCPECNSEIVYYDVAVDEIKKEVLDHFKCNVCHVELSRDKTESVSNTSFDVILNEIVVKPKYLPVKIKYTFNKKTFEKRFDQNDWEQLEKVDKYLAEIRGEITTFKIPIGEKTNEFIRKGYMYSHQCYLGRSYLILHELHKLIPVDNYELRLIFTSICQSLSSILVRYNLGNRGNGPLSGTIYVPSLIAESNIIKLYLGKLNDFIKAFRLLKQTNIQRNASSTDLREIAPSSIDYIFTDPPFGANLMYSDLNFLWESWLKIFTNTKEEAIQNRRQLKTFEDYSNLMYKSFLEFFRVLKPGKWMTVEFSNTNASIWNGIQTAIQKAGFVIANVAGLDKKQGSFNAVTNATSVKQDLVISCYKPSSMFNRRFKQNQQSEIAVWDFAEEHLNHLPIHIVVKNSTTGIIERSPKILYDRLIAFYVQRALPVPIDASMFQQGLRERFIERDGMFFTNSQAQEYDAKKAAAPNFTQMSIFVANEQDSIYWLRNILQKNRKTESDLHPFWMKEVAGNMRKGDTLPEMRTILEENFLKDNNGKWYVPDPENEADLEKLRTKRLIKQFDAYKAEAAKPKAKIKEVRVEALRAGFKQCYQDKDFKTIVLVGDKIPNNLLMEDEVLLQFYDIASSRV